MSVVTPWILLLLWVVSFCCCASSTTSTSTTGNIRTGRSLQQKECANQLECFRNNTGDSNNCETSISATCFLDLECPGTKGADFSIPCDFTKSWIASQTNETAGCNMTTTVRTEEFGTLVTLTAQGGQDGNLALADLNGVYDGFAWGIGQDCDGYVYLLQGWIIENITSVEAISSFEVISFENSLEGDTVSMSIPLDPKRTSNPCSNCVCPEYTTEELVRIDSVCQLENAAIPIKDDVEEFVGIVSSTPPREIGQTKPPVSGAFSTKPIQTEIPVAISLVGVLWLLL